MNLEQIAKSGSEQAHQRAVMQWAALSREKYPELKWLFHIPNGGSRGTSERDRMIRGAAMKADGVKKGVYDLCLPVRRGNFCGLYLEMKKPGEKVKPGSEQEEFGIFVKSQGYYSTVCDNYVDAISSIENYLNIFLAP